MFRVVIQSDENARSGYWIWELNQGKPLSWGYRVDQVPGKYGLARGGGFRTEAEARHAAEEVIASLNRI